MKTFLISIILLGLTVGLSPTLSSQTPTSTPLGTTTEEIATTTTTEGTAATTTTVETTTTTTTEEIVTEEPLSCSFPDYYCNPTAPDLIRKVEDVPVNSAKECQDLCKRQVQTVHVKVFYCHNYSETSNPMTAGLFCKDFTFFDFRGIKTCFLLKGCTDKRPRCTVPSACVSGRSSACGKYCPQLTHHEGEHVAWRCQGGINPYKENIPAGTPCYAK